MRFREWLARKRWRSRGRSAPVSCWPQSAPCHGALRQIMVADDHARFARSLRDCVAFSTAGWPDECNDTRRVAAKEGNHFCGGHRSYK